MIQDDYGNEMHPDTVQAINKRLDAGSARMTRLESNLGANTAATEEIRANTADLVEFFVAAQGAFKVLNWVARMAKPIGVIAMAGAAILAVWQALKGHMR